MSNRHTERFNRGSIFNGQEPWRREQGHAKGLEAELNVPPPPVGQHTQMYVDGWLEGRNAKKRQMMEDLILGKYDDDETEDIKAQLGLPPVLQP